MGEIAGGETVTLTVRADEVSSFQKVLGVDAPAVIGNLTAVRAEGFQTLPTAAACGLYVDHIIGGAPGQNRNVRSEPLEKQEK